MRLKKHSDTSAETIPLLAALTYSVDVNPSEETSESPAYDPTNQRTVYGMGKRNYSTCREDDSVGGLFDFGSVKSDVKKDD